MLMKIKFKKHKFRKKKMILILRKICQKINKIFLKILLISNNKIFQYKIKKMSLKFINQ